MNTVALQQVPAYHTVDSHTVNPLHIMGGLVPPFADLPKLLQSSNAFVGPVLLAVTTCTAPTEQPVGPHSTIMHMPILAHIAVYKPVIWLNSGSRTAPSMQWHSEQPQKLSVAQGRQLALYRRLSQPLQSEY